MNNIKPSLIPPEIRTDASANTPAKKYSLGYPLSCKYFPSPEKSKNTGEYNAYYPLIIAHNLSDLNYYRANHNYYLELPENRFVAYAHAYSPALRSLVLEQFTQTGDTIIDISALWLHTGFIPYNTMRQITIARTDGRKYERSVRRRIPQRDLMKIQNIICTTPARTAVDLLLKDLESAITALPKLIRAGTSIQEIYHLSLQINGVQGINRVRSILQQLREVPALRKAAK